MEILTALQWAKKGFIPNEEAKGTKQWTNSFYSAKAVYFKDSEVHEDKDTAKAILLAKRKEYRDVAKKRKEKRIRNAAYREKMKTQWQWLQEGRIPNDNARWEVGEELNKMFCTCAYGSNYCYCHERYTHEPKNDEEMQKAIFDFQQKELGMTINRVKKKFCSITNNDIGMNIDTEFNVGDSVCYLSGDNIIHTSISKIIIEISYTDDSFLMVYKLSDGLSVPRNNYPQWGKRLFRDKDSLMRYLSES